MEKFNEEDGVWRTIAGRRVFIRKGQSLSEAMIESGKFKSDARTAYRKAKEEENKKPIHKLGQTNETDEKINLDSEETKKSLQETKRKSDEWRIQHGEKPIFSDKEKGIEKSIEKNDKYKTTKREGFTQQTDMYGGTREYSKEQLDKMADNGVKPMEHNYTGGGWEGTKYDSNLSTKDIAKNINDYAKKEFPDVKLSRNTDYNGIDIHVMSSGKDLYVSASDIDKMSDKQVSDTIRDSIGGYTRMDDWLNANNRKSANGTFTVKDERDYLKEQLNTYKSRKGDNVSGNEWYLSDYGKKVISGLNKEMNSYNYDDSDGMVDYFNTNFYGYVKIGKWDKPYEVSESKSSGNQITNSLQMKAYEKYKREHPNTTKTFNDFKNMKK